MKRPQWQALVEKIFDRFDDSSSVVLRERVFRDLHPTPKRWVTVPTDDMVNAQGKPPVTIDTQLFDLIDRSYQDIGGHVDFQSPSDLPGNHSIWTAIDLDGNMEPDAVIFGKRTPYGTKWTGLATDGSREAKIAALDSHVKHLQTPGNYAEVSGAAGHIYMTRFHLPCIEKAKDVQRLLGPHRPITWIGSHPDGLYPTYRGFYTRNLGGRSHMKIMLGRL